MLLVGLAHPAKAVEASAHGSCSAAINASGNSIVTIRQVCNYSTSTPAQRMQIDKLVLQAQSTVRSFKSLNQHDHEQDAKLASLVSENLQLKDEIAAVVQRLDAMAAAPNATAEVRLASARLNQGDVAPAVAVLGKEAQALAATHSAPPSETAAVLLQQAALLQTQSVGRARDAVEAALAIAPKDSQALWAAAWLAYVAGKSDDAIGYYQRLLALNQADLSSKPDDPLIQRAIAAIYGSIGTVQLTKGDYRGAASSFGQSLAAAKTLVARDITNPDWQQVLEFAYANLGDLAMAQGLSQVAIENYQHSLEIATDQIKAFPGSDLLRANLLVAQTRIGDAENLLGHTDSAIEAYKQAADLLTKLIAAYPAFDGNYIQLATVVSKRAYVQLARGDAGSAQDSYTIAIHILRDRVARDPSNRILQRNLEIAVGGLGDAQLSSPAINEVQAKANLDAALASYSEAVSTATMLASNEAGNDLLQYDLWYALTRVGSAHGTRGELQLGLEELGKAQAVIRHLVEKNPQNPIFIRQLGLTLGKISLIQNAQGHAGAALLSLADAIGHASAAAKLDPSTRENERDMALYLASSGTIHAQQGDLPAASREFRESIVIRERVAASDPRNALWQLDLANANGQFALCPGSPIEERRAAMRKAVAIILSHQASHALPTLPDQFIEAAKGQLRQLETDPAP